VGIYPRISRGTTVPKDTNHRNHQVTEAAFLDLLLEEDEAEAVQVSSSSTLREMVPAVPAAQGRSMQQTGIRSFLPSGSASR